jgi:hypothetical protein
MAVVGKSRRRDAPSVAPGRSASGPRLSSSYPSLTKSFRSQAVRFEVSLKLPVTPGGALVEGLPGETLKTVLVGGTPAVVVLSMACPLAVPAT